MTTGLTYDTYLENVAELAVVESDDVNFLAISEQMITYAENRICRDIDFLQTVTTLTNRTTTNGQSYVDLGDDADTPDFVTLQEVNIITPAGATNPELGTVVPLLPVTKEFIRQVYPSAASKGEPEFFAPVTQVRINLGPWPGGVYTLQTVGTTRPDSLSSDNNVTFISTYFPDLFIMASMIYISAYQRNFGKIANEPEMAGSYENQYKTLLAGANIEEARKKFQSSAWTSMSPPIAATPSR